MDPKSSEMITKMDLEDFSHNFKWKLFIPLVFMTSWSLMFLGPLYFPYGYQIFGFVVMGYAFVKTFMMLPSFIVALYKMSKYDAVTRVKVPQLNSSDTQIANNNKIHHAFIIPSYREDIDLLSETLNHLGSHFGAQSTYIVMMAMEAHQPECQKKAEELIKRHGTQFKYMGFTKHKLREHESKGKASNVSWCGQHLMEEIAHLNISEDNIMVTVIDADSWAPQEYFAEIEDILAKRPEIKDDSMFCPPQIYTRNNLQVPIFNRVFDILMTIAHLSSMVAFYFTFPLSNYTLSYKLIKRIGFWDTCSDAIGEDFHTCQKCFWKSPNGIETVPIYIPFNQLSLQTGDGYCSDMKARFWQAQRHAKGVNDAAYSLHMLFSTPFKFRNLVLTILVLEVFLLAAILPWPLASIGVVYNLFYDDYQRNFPTWLVDLAINMPYIAAVVSYIFYECFKRQANVKYHHKENEGLWRCIEYPILFPIILLAYTLSFIVASFGALCNQNEYRVAQKVSKPKKGPEMQMTNPLLS